MEVSNFSNRVYYKARFFNGRSSMAMPAEVWIENIELKFRYIDLSGTALEEYWLMDKITHNIQPGNITNVLNYQGDELLLPSLEIESEDFSYAFLRRAKPKSLITRVENLMAQHNKPFVFVLAGLGIAAYFAFLLFKHWLISLFTVVG
ncbi:MAG: hypothetical protein EAZ57_07635 [Cytophagales bacterium]|nr:MAG: hypothetical protein EAZ67_08720 [Cytophagales bacterium]TAF60409.1 MAG: hypothetical protein EAZ57_07635 [Cytophagales bacterium]